MELAELVGGPADVPRRLWEVPCVVESFLSAEDTLVNHFLAVPTSHKPQEGTSGTIAACMHRIRKLQTQDDAFGYDSPQRVVLMINEVFHSPIMRPRSKAKQRKVLYLIYKGDMWVAKEATTSVITSHRTFATKQDNNQTLYIHLSHHLHPKYAGTAPQWHLKTRIKAELKSDMHEEILS